MKNPTSVRALLASAATLTLALTAAAQTASPAKPYVDYFRPAPILSPLSKDAWGAAAVGPRDTKNGLEDVTMKQWNYWDGQIIKGKDGTYHLFASRWAQDKGHNGWFQSKCVMSTSKNLYGPYEDKGLCWPNDQEGKGHNVTALTLPDGRYAIVVSETRPGEVFVSKSLDGPWESLGKLSIAPGEFTERRFSNVAVMVRPDGDFEIIPRSGRIWISKTGILGPYVIQGAPIYTTIPEMATHEGRYLEDPTIWFSGGLYHVTVNDWNARTAFHLTSVDGIHDWKFRGVAYDPRVNFVSYKDGTVDHWEKMERPSVYVEKGHVVAMTLAVIDVAKEKENGNDGHGSKIIVMPFDGAAMDRDLQKSIALEKSSAKQP